jgi:hypothetical protein
MNDTENSPEKPKRDIKFTAFAIAIVLAVLIVLLVTRRKNPLDVPGPIQPGEFKRPTSEQWKSLGGGVAPYVAPASTTNAPVNQ